jgi:hypothetical protein
MQTAIVSSSTLYETWWNDQETYPALSDGLLPTPTVTPTPTDTPTPALTPSATNTATPTVAATSTPALLPAPALLGPPDGATYVGWNADVLLTWTDVTGLDADEYYVVRIPYDAAGSTAEFWRKETSFQVPRHFSSSDVGFHDRQYNWTVQVVRCTSNCAQALDDNARKTGTPAGQTSATGLFYWQPDRSGAQPTPEPGVTKEPTAPPTPTPE